MNFKQKLVVCDVDEVIVGLSVKWTKQALEHEGVFNRVGNGEIIKGILDGTQAFTDCVLNRLEYDLVKWLDLSKLAVETFLDAYRKDGLFYDNQPLTKLGESLLYEHNSFKLVFVSHCIGAECDESKRRFIKKTFGRTDYAYEELPLTSSKSEVIKSRYADFDVFIDDLPSNLIDVMEHCGTEGQEFIFPAYGYNACTPIMAERVIKAKNLNLKVYRP